MNGIAHEKKTNKNKEPKNIYVLGFFVFILRFCDADFSYALAQA